MLVGGGEMEDDGVGMDCKMDVDDLVDGVGKGECQLDWARGELVGAVHSFSL